MNRREFARVAGGTLLSLGARHALAASGKFCFAAIADTHIIDEFYKGPESDPEDSESIFQSAARLTAVRDHFQSLGPLIEQVCVCGDFFHNYPSTDLGFYSQHRTRIDIAKGLIDSFKMPVHVAFGNHDYDVPEMSREASHQLFRSKLGLDPYCAVEHKGVRFVLLNNFLGATWDPKSPHYDRSEGSFGEQQLNWFEAELRRHQPTFVFLHYPLLIVAEKERADYGLLPLLKKYRDTVQLVVAGHWHKWAEFGRTFGPPHQVIASTRYDPNAYLIVEVDTAKATHRLLNIDGVEWNTHYSKPWRP